MATFSVRKNLIIIEDNEPHKTTSHNAIVRNAIANVFTTDAIACGYITAVLHTGDRIILWSYGIKEENEHDKLIREMNTEFEKILDFLRQ